MSSFRRWLVRAGTPILFGWSALASAAMPMHTFDTDAQGWRFAGGDVSSGVSSLSYIGGIAGWDGRGNPGGALSAPDVYGETFIAAPSEFLGDQSDMYGKSITYDILIRATDEVDYTPFNILGGGLNLVYSAARPPIGVWERRTVLFDPTMWRVGANYGAVATEAELRSALADLEGMFICTEWKTGGDDTSVDNVGAVPEPGSLAVLLIGAALARRRR